MQNFKDESFVGQYLSPQLMRDMRLFSIHDDASERELLVSAIHDDDGYRTLRQTLSQQYDLGAREPNIQVWNVNLRGDRCLTDRKSTRLNSSHQIISYAVFCLKKKTSRR